LHLDGWAVPLVPPNGRAASAKRADPEQAPRTVRIPHCNASRDPRMMQPFRERVVVGDATLYYDASSV